MVGVTAAILGSAVIGAGASAISSSKNSKAINQATTAQTQAANENAALTREIYAENKSILSPFVTSGTMAGNNINALLGLGGDPVAARSAFDVYRGSTGYDWRLNEGMKGLNASFAGRGLGNSGAAAKAALTFGQNIGSDEFGRYVGYLTNQQGVGLSAGSALAGVGQNYVNSISNNNSALASAIGNGAIAKANNSGNFLSNIAGIGGWAAGGLSSYGGAPRNPYGIAGEGIY